MGHEAMKNEYDFSKGERGRFYRRGARLNLPVYMEPEVRGFVEGLARERGADVSTVVNELLKADIESARPPK